ncbi:MAG: Gfo/Idh/MocA family protein [bacterium]
MERKVKIGFVGAGFMSQMAHLPSFLETEGCEVVAISELRPNLRERVGEKYKIPKRYPSHRELAEDEEVEAVVALLPYLLNSEIATYLLEKGKDVMVEKPMAFTYQLASKMVEASRKSGRFLMVGYMKRYDPGVQLAHKIIQDFLSTGELGEPTFVRVHIFGGEWVCNIGTPILTDEPYPSLPERRADFLPSKLLNMYDEFINVASHNINLLRFLLKGKWNVEDAFLKGNQLLAVLSKDNIICSLEYGRLPAHRWDEDLTIYFQKGWIRVETPPPLLKNVPARILVYKTGSEPQIWEPIAPWGWAFKKQAEHFVSCVRDRKTPLSSGEDSLEDMLIAEEIFKKIAGH